MDHRTKALKVFNAHTDEWMKLVDSQLNNNVYYRGYLFRKIVKNKLFNKAKILDYGCGQGSIAYLLAKEGYDVLGMDPIAGFIAEANKKSLEQINLKFRLLEDEGESLPSNTYDAVVCSSALEFMDDADFVLQNLHRTLKPGGILFISLPNIRSLWRYYAEIRFGKKYDHFAIQKNKWSVSKAIKHLMNAGFSIKGKPIFFESAFDKYKLLRSLNSFSLFGTLFILICQKNERHS